MHSRDALCEHSVFEMLLLHCPDKIDLPTCKTGELRNIMDFKK